MRHIKIIFSLVILIFITFIMINSGLNLYSSDLPDTVDIDNTPASDISLRSNKYTQYHPDDVKIAADMDPYLKKMKETDDYLLITSDERLELYVNKLGYSILVYDKYADYWYGSDSFKEYNALDADKNPLYPELYDASDYGVRKGTNEYQRMVSAATIRYYIKGDTSIRDLEEAITLDPASSITSTVLANGLELDFYFALAKIGFKMIITLENGSLNISIPGDSIKEDGPAELYRIIPFPYFGATKKEVVPGYVMIPDGTGALMRFKSSTKATTPFYKKFYGTDYGETGNDFDYDYGAVPEGSLNANMFLSVHGNKQNGFIAIVDKGAGNAGLHVTPSSRALDFNQAYVSFDYRVRYDHPLNQSQTLNVSLVQAEKNMYDAGISYRFLSGDEAHYVGAAKVYRDYLGLTRNELSGDIPLQLDVLAAENKKWIIGNQVFSMTKINELKGIIEDLRSNNINKMTISYQGFQSGGYGHTFPNIGGIDGVIGSGNDLKNLIHDYENSGINIYLYAEVLRGHDGAGGYSGGDVAQMLTSQAIDNIYYGYRYLSVDFAKDIFKRNYDSLKKNYDAKNIAFGDLGNELYSDHKKTNKTRSETIEEIREIYEYSGNGGAYKPNNYLWQANDIFDAPMYTSRRDYYDDAVPFMPVVLAGYSNVYARNANFFSNTRNELLRMIDYNMYPSFIITHESATLLVDSYTSNIYTSRYTDWKDEIISQYNYVNRALKGVSGSEIISRDVLALGVVKVTYSNSVSILVNYSARDFDYLGNNVKSNDYLVIK